MTIAKSLYAIRRFVHAAEFEREYEQLDHPHFGIDGVMRQVPRAVMLSGLTRYASFVTVVLPVAQVVWAVFCAPILFFAQFAHSLATSIWVSKANVEDISAVYLGTSNSTNLNWVVPRPSNFPQMLVVSPFRGIVMPSTTMDVHRRGLLELVSPWILLKSLAAAIVVNWLLLSSATRHSSLWGYTAFQWFVTYFAISSTAPRYIWVSNHYDRWIVLAASVKGASAIIVQHGSLSQQIDSTQIEFKTNEKLSNISEIYYYDVNAVGQFSLYVDTTNTTFIKMDVRIQFGSWRDLGDSQTKVLILGGSGSLKLFERIIEGLIHEFNDAIDIAIKHHPLQRHGLRQNDVNAGRVWELFGEDPLPLADIVVSYGSSLDAQIAEHSSARLINYRWMADNNFDSVCELINEGILSFINSRAGVNSGI